MTGLSEVIDQVESGKMRLLAVSSPVDVEVDGKKPPTLKDEGIDLVMDNWRAIAAPPGITDAERERIAVWVTRVAESAAWKKSSEKFDWTPLVKTGAELDRYLASEQKRVRAIVTDLGLNQ
jgi:putative tricarboxylic transport membrane protein